jgi:DNA repair exonuclease SbcCD ATPase subunit
MTRIIKLEANNFKRLKAVEITPTGDLVVISGRNGQGKTSVLDAITAALGGNNTKALPRPIRDGAGSAEIVLETEDFTVTRRFTPSGSTLSVVGKDGVKIGKGQAKLDALLGKLSLDPLAFTQLDDKAQLKTLLDLVDLPFDPAKLEAERAGVFETRTDVNRDLKALLAQQSAFAAFPVDTPTEEVSVTALLAEYRAGQDLERAQAADLQDLATLNGEIGAINRQIGELVKRRAAVEDQVDNIAGRIDKHAPLPDLEDLDRRIATVEQTNESARAYAAYQRLNQRIADVKASADLLTEQIEQIDKRKRDGLAAAKFPGGLPLGFDDTGVLLNGVPFKQASGAEQLRASLAMAIALNPALRVIRIADGSLLDSEGLQLVADMAAAADCQVWLEVVSDGDGAGICIEDGEIADPDFF